jgi:hypothetical protein
MKGLLIKSAIASSVVLCLATVTRPVMAATFVVSIEDAKVVNANLGNLVSSQVQSFDGLSTGYSATGFDWNSGTNKIGSYQNTLIMNADQFGGAGANSQYNNKNQYFDVDTNRSGQANFTVSTLKLTTAQKYFGLWWSAGDSSNVLQFLSNGQVVQTMTTADVKNYINNLANKSDYYGNPTAEFKDNNTGEPYAFLNFYNVDGTFDEVKFSNIGGSGFESDNHTVASSYTKYSGSIVTAVPESSSLLGVLAIGFVGASSFLTRRVKKSSVA